MKYVKQFCIILLISFIGELCSYLIPLPIPASIYGLVILFVGLTTHRISLDSVKEVGHFLVEIMPVMFIPAAVGLVDSWGQIKKAWLPYTIVTLATTIVVMVVAGRVTQRIVRRRKEKNV